MEDPPIATLPARYCGMDWLAGSAVAEVALALFPIAIALVPPAKFDVPNAILVWPEAVLEVPNAILFAPEAVPVVTACAYTT